MAADPESEPKPEPNRLVRRKMRTRAALVRAAQTFIAEGNLNAPILEITKAADVGMGSFYNHFQTKDELFQAAVDDALEAHGAVLDTLGEPSDDPVETFTRSFRLTGRLHRKAPQLSRVLLRSGTELITSDRGLAPRAIRDLRAAIDSGRFKVEDPELAMVVAAGALLGLGQLLLDRPDRDDAAATDQIAEDLLRMFGVSAAKANKLAHTPLPSLDDLPPPAP
ncbi:TetR family transcriptional regulator [Kribbella sp. VKM Ac-2527]|uniref:TetR family transcriptional regulator n=1 Tax=Kribbella caucasensis TaxID=2512215 RepID=A0A4R6JDM3_9ACTN|nr:TetR/AcrR family transcriptional regulator [Kribbella sp. VKM Ac-2527]TDO33970.1 TetR family transcriptional regulator [Kribbella sp. VKM Ac-2527]